MTRRTAMPASEGRDRIQKAEAAAATSDGDGDATMFDLLGLGDPPDVSAEGDAGSDAGDADAGAGGSDAGIDAGGSDAGVDASASADAGDAGDGGDAGTDAGASADAGDAGDGSTEGGDAGGTEGGAEGTEAVTKVKAVAAVKAGKTSLATLTRIAKQAGALAEGKPLTGEMSTQLQAVIKALNLLGGDSKIIVVKVVDGMDKTPLLALTSAIEGLVKVTNDVGDLKEDAELTDEMGGSLKGIAKSIEDIVTKFSAAAKPAKSAKPAVTKTATATAPTAKVTDIEVFKAMGSDKDKDPMIVFKAGAKMKKIRLSQFARAVEALQSILKELSGEEVKKNAEPTTVAVSADVDLSPVTKAIEALGGRVDEKIEVIGKSVDALGERLDAVEGIRPTGASDDDAGEATEVKKSVTDLGWGSVLAGQGGKQ